MRTLLASLPSLIYVYHALWYENDAEQEEDDLRELAKATDKTLAAVQPYSVPETHRGLVCAENAG